MATTGDSSSPSPSPPPPPPPVAIDDNDTAAAVAMVAPASAHVSSVAASFGSASSNNTLSSPIGVNGNGGNTEMLFLRPPSSMTMINTNTDSSNMNPIPLASSSSPMSSNGMGRTTTLSSNGATNGGGLRSPYSVNHVKVSLRSPSSVSPLPQEARLISPTSPIMVRSSTAWPQAPASPSSPTAAAATATAHQSAFALPSDWHYSICGLIGWLIRCTIPSMGLVLAIFSLPLPPVTDHYVASEHWLYQYVGMPLVGTFAGWSMCYRASLLAGVMLRPRTLALSFVILYASLALFAWASSSAGFIWWRVIIAEFISMFWSVTAPRLLEKHQFKLAAVNYPQLRRSAGQVAATLVGVMIIGFGFQLLFTRIKSSTVQDWLIIILNGMAFVFRLLLTITARHQPIAYRVLLGSFYSIYLFDVFVSASLPSAKHVSTLILTAVIQLAVHIAQPLQLTHRYHALKMRFERRFGLLSDDWPAHLERHTVVYFFSLFAHLCVPFLFFWTTLLFQYGPLYESGPQYGKPVDRINNTLWFHGLQTISVSIQIVIFSTIIRHQRQVNMLQMAYYVIRSGSWLLLSFTLVAPMFAFPLILKQCDLQAGDDD